MYLLPLAVRPIILNGQDWKAGPILSVHSEMMPIDMNALKNGH